MPGESDVTIEIVEETPIVIEMVQTGPSGLAGGVQTIVPGDNIDVDDTDPLNPIVSANVPVTGVNGQVGEVVLDQDDVGDGVSFKQYSAADKTKLAGIEAGAEVNDVDSVAGRTGDVVLTKTDVGLPNVDNVQQQPIDADLTAIAAMDSSTAGAIASDGAGWVKKTYAQLKTALGLGNVDNTSDANKPISTATQTALDAKLDDSQKGVAGGLAELDGSGLVPTSQLPAYVDDVVTVADFASLPVTGETGKIYITLDTNLTYRWNGSGYTEISASLALGETSATAYRGDRGKIAYDHSQIITGNPHQVTKAEVGLGSVPNIDTTNDYRPGGTDVPIADGGTGASTAAAARDNLGVEIGVDVQAYDADLDGWSGKTPPSGAAVGTTDTQTLSNKRTVPRVTTIVSSGTPTVNTDNCDAVEITALAANITSMTTNLTGTPNNFDKLTVRIKDNGTSRTIAWGASFSNNGVALPTATVINKFLIVGFIWNGATWGCVASAQEF